VAKYVFDRVSNKVGTPRLVAFLIESCTPVRVLFVSIFSLNTCPMKQQDIFRLLQTVELVRVVGRSVIKPMMKHPENTSLSNSLEHYDAHHDF